MAYLDIDGIVIDEETGEIIDGAEDSPNLLIWAVHRLADANTQRKQWERQEGALKALLMREMPDKKATDGTYVVSLVSGSERKTFNREAWRGFMEDEELTLSEWREIALNAERIDQSPACMTPAIFELLCFTKRRSADYVTVAPVRKTATARVVERGE